MSAKNKTEVKKVLGLIGIYIVIYIVKRQSPITFDLYS